MAAAFAKRLSRLALSVPPAGALIIIALIHNLLRRHPSINFLVHWEVDDSDSNAAGEADQTKKIGADPFNNQETDPAKAGAMRSSLWEIDTLRHRYSPAVSRFVESLENDLTVRAKTSEMKITDFSSGSYATVFRDEARRRIKQVPLAFYRTTPTSLLQGPEFPGWTFGDHSSSIVQAMETVEASDNAPSKRLRVVT